MSKEQISFEIIPQVEQMKSPQITLWSANFGVQDKFGESDKEVSVEDSPQFVADKEEIASTDDRLEVPEDEMFSVDSIFHVE